MKKMSPQIYHVFVLSLAAFASAQIPSIGWCPDYLPMANFDMDKFLGKWYESERYFTFSDVVSRCVVTDYAKAPSGRIYISNEVTNRITGVKRVIGGHLELSGKGNEGRLNVKYATTPLSTESTLTVLDTDYDNYAVIWSCGGLGPFTAQNVWVMTRNRLPPGIVLQRAYGVLDKFRINRSFVVKSDQEGCAIIAADLNAANGILPSSTVPQAVGAEQKSANVSGDTVSDDKPLEVNAEKEEVQGVSEETKIEPETVAEHILAQASDNSKNDEN